MEDMISYPKAAMERTMKIQEVILRAIAKRITWWQAAEIVGVSDRRMRRWRERYEEFGYWTWSASGKPSSLSPEIFTSVAEAQDVFSTIYGTAEAGPLQNV